MDALIPRYCLSLLLLTSIARSVGSNETKDEELREPRVTGRIVKLYSGAKPEPYLCTGEGFQADPSSCAAFYRCVKERSGKFTVFRYQCAPGTVYDPDVETCNHPRSTRRTDCGGMLKPIVEPHHTANINEIDGAQSEIPRPTKVPIYAEQTIPKNPTTLSWILSTESQDPTKTPWPSTSTTKLDDSTTKKQWLYSTQHHWESQYTTKPPSKTAQSSNSINTEPCTSDGFMGDSENCRKFYRCVGNQRGGYVKYEFSCSESTVWDDEIKGCNHPWAVKRSNCGRSLSYDDKSTSHKQDLSWSRESTTKSTTLNNGEFGKQFNKTIQHQIQISHGSKATQTQTQISNSPNVIQNQTQINYGDKENNTHSKYIQNQRQINYGTSVSQAQTQIDYGNKGMQTQLQIDHSKAFSQSQVQIVDATTQSTTSTRANNNSKYECTESGFMGDANDCRKFYRCVNNGRGYTKYEYSCGDGTVWDPEIEACNHAWAVKECGAKHSGSSSTETYATNTAKLTENHSEHTKTTLSYTTSQIPDIDDEDDVGYGNQNNQEVTTSSTTIKTTTTTAKSTTQKPSGAATECTITGFIGDANNCKVFYRCVDNGNSGFIKHEFKCGDGTVWDPDIEACNHVWAVEKCGGSTSSDADKEEATTKKENTTPAKNVHTTITLIQITTQAPTKGDDYDTGYGSQQHEPSTTVTPNTPANKPISPPQDQGTNNNTICKSSGFVGDENDCKKFYRCVDNGNGGYIKYEFTCGQGTVWDPKIDVCNYAWAVEKCGGSNHINESSSYETTSQLSSTTGSSDWASTSKETNSSMTTTSTTSSSTTSNKCSNSGFMGDTNNCKKFYRCVDNGDGNFIRYEFTCGEGTVWDPKIEACNHAWAVEKCDGSGVTREPQQTTLQYPVMQDEYQNNGYVTPNYKTSDTPQSTVATSSSSTTTSTTSDETGHCTNSGFMRDENDCKKFYRCVDNSRGGYDRYEFQCGEGTDWNQEMQACDHESSHKSCSGSSIIQTQTTESHSESTSSSSTPKNQETTNKTDTSESMGSQCKSEGFIAHPNDCKKFIRCVDNGNGGYIRYEFSCGDGTIWVQEIQACDHDNDVNSCTPQVRHTTQVSNTESNPPSSRSSSSVTFSTESMPSNEEYDTQILNEPFHDETDDCTSEGYFANKQDCRKFYRCIDNAKGGYTKYNFACGEGTAWDSDGQTCNYINNVQSCSGPIQAENENHHLIGTTTNKNKAEPEGTSSTTKATSTGTTESPNSQDTCESEGYFGDSIDCKKFYRCVDDGKGGYTKYDFTCGDGTIWDQDITTCNHPQDVSNPSCSSSQGSSDTSSTTSSTTSSSQTTSSPSQGSSSSQSTSDCSQESSKKPGNNNVTCDKAGYFGNPNDCKKFYRCVDWDGDGKRFSVFHFECGEGTIWDPALDTCNHEDSVYPQRDCSTQSQNVGGETSTTEKSTTTTVESTTSDQTTQESATVQQTTSEKTTTEQSNEPTTTQETTTSETTQESTSSEQTTTQQTTTSEKTTTPEPTTSEQTTTQQPATSEQTTTPQTTPSEQTTTEKFSTSEQTTNEPSTTSEQTTTRQTTTSEQTTISEQTTTQQSTTSEQTTTQQSITSEQTTTQQSTTVELTTIREQTTTQQSTNGEQSTSQQSTTSEQTTTRQSTPSDQTTISEQTTTQQTTSEQTTTPQSTASEQVTQQSTTEQTTTQESSTSAQTTTQQSTTSDQTTTEQTTTEQTTTEQTTTEQTTTEQTTTEQTTTEQTTTEQTTTEQTITEQTTTEQSSTSDQTTIQQSSTSEQTTPQQPTTSEQTTPQQSTTSEASTIQQTTTSEQTTTQQSTTSEQTTSTEQSNTTTEIATDGTTTTDNTTDGTTTEEIIDQSTTETSNTESDSTEDASSTTEEFSSDDKKCPETEDDQYLLVCPTSFKRHPKYCNMFYQCIEDDETYEAKVAMFKCPNNTIYDESQIQCVTEDKAHKKCDGQIANKRRFKRLGSNYKEPIEASKGNQSCSSTGYFSFEKHTECAKGFLKCEKSKNGGFRGYVYQCPDGYIYWSISKRCERIENVKDCKRSGNDWTGRWNIPVERKNVAYS